MKKGIRKLGYTSFFDDYLSEKGFDLNSEISFSYSTSLVYRLKIQFIVVVSEVWNISINLLCIPFSLQNPIKNIISAPE
jgi:hypothetical protein